MTSYKLFYFNGMSRAELIRYIFAAAGVQFEDIRIDLTEWVTYKPKFQFQQVPALQIDEGPMLYQSIAIAHYLAKKFNFVGNSDIEEAQSLAIVEQTKDLLDAAANIFWTEKDEERKKVARQLFHQNLLKNSLSAFEVQLSENSTKSGYFIGNSLTFADLAVHSIVKIILGYLELEESVDLLAEYPALKAHREKICNHPAISEYLKNRPQSKF